MPAGNKIWQFSDRCCDRCKASALEYNKQQDTIVNEPAKVNPPIPEPPAIMPEEEPSPSGANTENYRYTPRRFF